MQLPSLHSCILELGPKLFTFCQLAPHTSSSVADLGTHNTQDIGFRMADPPESAENPTSATFGSLCEVKLLEQRYDEHGRLITNQIEGKKAKDDFSQHALVQRLIFSQDNKLVETRLDINSPYILQALDTVADFYPAHPAPFNEPVTIQGPYMILGHYWEELSNYASSTQDDKASVHLDLLLRFMEREMGDGKRKSERLLAVGHITFPFLWMICKPGSLLLAERCGQYRLFRLLGATYGEHCMAGRYCKLRVSFSDYDGSNSGRRDTNIYVWENKQPAETMQVKQVAGEMGHHKEEMSIYPLEYAENAQEMLTALKSRGEKFWGFRGIYVQRYRGILRYLKTPPLGFFSKDSDESDYVGIFASQSVSFTPKVSESLHLANSTVGSIDGWSNNYRHEDFFRGESLSLPSPI